MNRARLLPALLAAAVLGCEAVPELPDAVPGDDAGEDAGLPPDAWGELAASGPTLAEIAGVASQMNTAAGDDPLRDFEYAQYAPYPGFRMRNGHRWESVEPVQGQWRWDEVSGSVDGARDGRSKVLMGLDYAPEWARDGGLGTVHIDDFAAYAGAMAERFCNEVKEYEVWNEPNLARFWDPAPDPARFADLMIASWEAIHAACPDATVLFGGMSSYDETDLFDTWGFLRRALAARPALCDRMDGVGLHPYTWFQFDPPEHDERMTADAAKPSQTRMVAIAREILAEAGCGGKPLYFTEVGWPSYGLAEEDTARYAARSLLLTARDGVLAWCWYTFWDFDPVTDGLRPHEHYFGMFGWIGPDRDVRRPKPSWIAVTAALDRLHGHRFARDLGPALGLPEDVYALAFVGGDGGIVVAAWDGREMPDVGLDGSVADGGPGTTFPLALPLPSCTGTPRCWDQWGDEQPAPAVVGGVATVILTGEVRYLDLGCGPTVRPDRPASARERR